MSFSIEKKSEKCHRLRLVEANSSRRNPSQKDWNGGRLSSNMIRLIGVVNRSLSADDVFPSSDVSGHFQLVSSPAAARSRVFSNSETRRVYESVVLSLTNRRRVT